MRSITRLYSNLMNTHPLAMQMTNTGILMSCGDVLAQTQLEDKSLKDVNWQRTCVYGLTGTFFVAPIVSRWYIFMERTLKGSEMTSILKKVAVDQLVFAPSFFPLFIIVTGFGQQKTWQDIKKELKENYVSLIIANYKIWPWVQLINFYYMPVNYRLVFAQSIALVWNAYLSFVVK